MKNQIKTMLAGAVLTLSCVTVAQAATVVCGDSSLGIRTTTVDPALAGSCYAGLTNLGDNALVSLVNSEYGISSPNTSVKVDRDTADTNGGPLSITGVGAQSGTWSFTSSLWNTYERMFLYFHFGDGPDNPSPTSTSDPDIFIVELIKPDSSGTWSFFDGGTQANRTLSNIALLGYDEGRVPPGGNIPEPGTASIAVLSFGILGGMTAWQRRRNRSAK